MLYVLNILTFGLFDNFLLLLGGFDQLLSSLFIILFLDVVTSISKLLYFFTFDLKKIIMWFIRNVGIFVVIILSVTMDKFLGNGVFIRDVVIYTFLINKITNILILWKNMGLKMPSIINKTLDKINTLK